MINISMRMRGTNPKKMVRKVVIVGKGVNKAMDMLGIEVVKKFQDVIKKSRRRGPSRSGNRMSKSIKKYRGGKGISYWVGIGKVLEMDTLAPYWRVINYGGFIPPPSVGYFGDHNPPDAGLVGQGYEPWTEGADGFYMIPKSAIRPMNFVETTQNWFASYWKRYWAKEFKKLLLKSKTVR
jgi:hypothetical protein